MRIARVDAADIVDVFVYTAVLSTFTQLLPEIISESFLASLVTALLLKIVLEIVLKLKTALVARLKSTNRVRVRAVSILSLVLLGGGSKALILWLTDFVLGDAVYLGGFFAVTLLVVALMLARAGVRRIVK